MITRGICTAFVWIAYTHVFWPRKNQGFKVPGRNATMMTTFFFLLFLWDTYIHLLVGHCSPEAGFLVLHGHLVDGLLPVFTRGRGLHLGSIRGPLYL